MKFFCIFFGLLVSMVSSVGASAESVSLSNAEVLNVQTTSYDFGFQMINTSRSVTFDIVNTGETDLAPESTFVRGASFGARHTCLKVLKPQQSCQVTIRFEPFFEGLFSGSFETYFQGGAGVVIRLWGRGQRW